MLPVPDKTRNVAEAVDIPPTSKSSVIVLGERVPEFCCQYWVLADAVAQPGMPPETVSIWPDPPMGNLPNVLATEA